MKDKIQKEGLEAWRKAGFRGTLVLHVGLGKTKTGIDAINMLLDKVESVLIVVPTTRLRDEEWPNEIEKWAPHIKDKVTIKTKNKAWKDNNEYDMIIVDEIQETLSEKYGKVHTKKCKYKLGLTATPPKHREEQMELLKETCPIIYNYSIKKGVKKGTAHDYKIFNIPVTLTQKERRVYTYWDRQFEINKAKINEWRYKMIRKKQPTKNSFEIAKEAKDISSHPLHEEAKMYWLAMSRRKHICYQAENKIEAIKDLIELFPERKWLIFSKSIKFIEKTGEKIPNSVIYHSKMSQTQKEEAQSKFKDAKVICSVDALNTGLNLPELDSGIAASGTSTVLDNEQRLGRIVRIADNKPISIFINLFAHKTQEEVWVKNRTKNAKSKTYTIKTAKEITELLE